MSIETKGIGKYMGLEYVEPIKTVFLNIWVTCNCNYRCEYCYEGHDKSNFHMDILLADQTVQFIIDMINKKGLDCIKINFHGGEPTLNFMIVEYIVERIRKYSSIKIATSMTTNCSTYISNAVDTLDEISVSIDGKKETHDRKRKRKDGQGTFDVSFSNALLYLKAYPDVNLNMVVTADNAIELYDNIMFFVRNGFRNITPSIDYFDANWNDDLFEVLYLQLKKVKEEICFQGLKDVKISIFDQLISTKKRCIVGMDQFQIMPDGCLYPCAIVAGLPDYCFGNVKFGIDKQKVEQLNKLMDSKVYECSDCSYYDCCMTCRCYFFNEKLTGSMYSPSGVVCAVEHLRMKLKRV